jgi:hypothetical protein
LKKLGLPILALAGVMMFVGAPRADAKRHFRVHHDAYPYAYDPYYYPYGYGYDYPYYGGGSFGGFGGGHHDRDDRGRVGRGFGGAAPSAVVAVSAEDVASVVVAEDMASVVVAAATAAEATGKKQRWL